MNEFSRRSRLLMRKPTTGFTSTAAWMTNTSYMHQQRSKQRKTKFKKVTSKNILRFQLWNHQQHTWNTKLLKQQPTLLKERDIIKRRFNVTVTPGGGQNFGMNRYRYLPKKWGGRGSNKRCVITEMVS